MTRQTLALKANGPRTATWGRNPFAFAGTAFENMSGIHKGLSPADLALEIGWWGESRVPYWTVWGPKVPPICTAQGHMSLTGRAV